MRTIFDIAAVVDEEQLERAVANGRVRGWLVKEGDLLRQHQLHGAKRGTGNLRDLLEREAEPAFIRSEAERITLRRVREADLPQPETNKVVHGIEVDLLWPAEKVVVEFDSWEFHADRGAFERDRAKSNHLQLHGYLVLRVTWRQLTRHPGAVKARIQAAPGRFPSRAGD